MKNPNCKKSPCNYRCVCAWCKEFDPIENTTSEIHDEFAEDEKDVRNQAVQKLEEFADIWCRVNGTDDLKFRCLDCAMKDRVTGKCAIKVFGAHGCMR